MKYVGTFEGIGGFSLGFDAAGMTSLGHIEIDKHCQTILDRHFPGKLIGEDIKDVAGDNIGRPDLLCGGFPCQGVAARVQGGRLGLADPRSHHYYELIRLIEEHLRLVDSTRPRWVVIENTPGLLTSPGLDKETGIDRTGWDMAAVHRGLVELGYGVSYRVVDGHGTGSAQRRERVLIVAHRGGDPRPAWEVLGDPGPSSEAARPRPLSGAPRGPQTVVSPGAGSGAIVFRKSARARAALSKGGYETWVPSEYSNTLTPFDGGGFNRQTHVVLQNSRLRSLTFTEWERLQMFPDDWTVGVPDSARFQMLGNAMNVGMATWLGHRLMAVDAALPLIGAR